MCGSTSGGSMGATGGQTWGTYGPTRSAAWVLQSECDNAQWAQAGFKVLGYNSCTPTILPKSLHCQSSLGAWSIRGIVTGLSIARLKVHLWAITANWAFSHSNNSRSTILKALAKCSAQSQAVEGNEQTYLTHDGYNTRKVYSIFDEVFPDRCVKYLQLFWETILQFGLSL